MPSDSFSILVIGNNGEDVETLETLLKAESSIRFALDHAACLAEAFPLLARRRFDAILLDLNLPDAGGLDALRRVQRESGEAAIVILTEEHNEPLGLEAVRSGAEDYLIKGRLDGGIPARCLRNAVERKRIEIELRTHRDRLDELVTERTVELVETNEMLRHEIEERKRAEERLRSHMDRMEALHAVDLAIAETLDLQVTLNVLLDKTTSLLGLDAADILLMSPRTQSLTFAAGRGFRTTSLQKTSLRIGEGLAGRAALERHWVHIPDLRENQGPLARSPLLESEGFVAYYAIPLIVKGRVNGVLEVFRRAPLRPETEWLAFLESFALQTAIAIENSMLFVDLQTTNTRLELACDNTLAGWARALELRDRQSEGHAERVLSLSVRLARTLGIAEDHLPNIRRGSLLHDVGLMGVSDEILLKPGPLSDSEWEVMKRHPLQAYDILSPIEFLRPALDIPLHHHERWDGKGYPHGLKGEHIPRSARLFAVVDVWDSLRSNRPYRAAWPRDQSLNYLHGESGKQFDAEIVGAFLTMEEDMAAAPPKNG